MKWKPTLNAFTITFTGRLERPPHRAKPPDHTHRLSDRPHLEHGTARRGVWVNSASVCPCGFYGRAACWPAAVWCEGFVVGSRDGWVEKCRVSVSRLGEGGMLCLFGRL